MGIPNPYCLTDKNRESEVLVKVQQRDLSRHYNGMPVIPPRMKRHGPKVPEKPPHIRLMTLTKKIPFPPSLINKKSEIESMNYINVLSNDLNQKLFLGKSRKPSAGIEFDGRTYVDTRDRSQDCLSRVSLQTPKLDVKKYSSKNSGMLLHCSPNSARRPFIERGRTPGSDQNRGIMPIANQPVILIPRSQLDTRKIKRFWSANPIAYSLFRPNSVKHNNGGFVTSGRGGIIGRRSRTVSPQANKEQQEIKIFVSSKNTKHSPSFTKKKSIGVMRSGSLTSHDSISSDSGNDTFPKSVLKKHKLENDITFNDTSNMDQKKNVTFNAFATVQVMDE